jgi:hypothetical protein
MRSDESFGAGHKCGFGHAIGKLALELGVEPIIELEKNGPAGRCSERQEYERKLARDPPRFTRFSATFNTT